MSTASDRLPGLTYTVTHRDGRLVMWSCAAGKDPEYFATFKAGVTVEDILRQVKLDPGDEFFWYDENGVMRRLEEPTRG